MTNGSRRFLRLSAQAFLVSFLALASLAQEGSKPANPDDLTPASPVASDRSTHDAAADEGPITVPAGTRLPLVLTVPLDSRSSHDIHAQITAPVIVGEKVAIPAGTFLQGKIEKQARRGSRAEINVKPASLVFANGYVATVNNAVEIESDEETAWANPSTATKVGIIAAPEIGLGLGAAIGAAAHTTNTTTFAGQTMTTSSPRGVAIGSIAGLAAGAVVSLALMARSHHFYVEEGSPLEATLPQDITLSATQVSAALEKSATQPPPMPVRASRAPPSAQASSAPTGPGSCSAGQEWCNGQCVNSSSFINDDSNCGRCGNMCSFNQSCTGTSCGCAPGYESCMGQCVSSASFIGDSSNCGRCGNSCSAGESCLGGSCTKPGM